MQLSRLFTAEKQAIADDSCTSGWSIEAQELFKAEFFCKSVPYTLKPVEENTIPSWLWKHSGENGRITSEDSIHQVLHRVAGSATYTGWKKDLFADENDARVFYDEVIWMLANRVIALEPTALSSLGTDWAYNLVPVPIVATSSDVRTKLELTNQSVDAILSGSDNGAQSQWCKFLGCEAEQTLSLRFSDTAKEWGDLHNRQTPRLMINLSKILRGDGSVDISAIQRVSQLSVLLLELLYEQLAAAPDNSRPMAIGYCNAASVLMLQGIAYDSDEGRSMIAAISSIITATATLTSAQLAQQLGPCSAFSASRTASLRAVANRHRSANGDTSDYEHVSVLPVPLVINEHSDLALLAAARHLWDEALIAAQRYGLRHLQLTSLFEDPEFTVLTECSSVGICPERSLLHYRQTELDAHRREINPMVPVALTRLGYDPADIKAIIDHIAGYGTLQAAPAINHDALKARGFDGKAISRIEDYIPRTNNIRFACTPWIVGEDFCRNTLKIPSVKLQSPDFDLLAYVGFSASEIIAANHFCYGHGNVETSTELKHEHRAVFSYGEDIDAKAQIRMAASVQSFITGDTGLALSLPASVPVNTRSDLLIDAWKQGLKNITLYIEHAGRPSLPAAASKASSQRTKIIETIGAHELPVNTAPSRQIKHKATSRMVSISGKAPSSGRKPGHKNRPRT